MDVKIRKTIRTKKLGVLIRDARLAARKSIRECAEAIGVSPGTFSSYERGRKATCLWSISGIRTPSPMTLRLRSRWTWRG